ncbi:unnamed protein product, partial [Phaeothamnion confervicola]
IIVGVGNEDFSNMEVNRVAMTSKERKLGGKGKAFPLLLFLGLKLALSGCWFVFATFVPLYWGCGMTCAVAVALLLRNFVSWLVALCSLPGVVSLPHMPSFSSPDTHQSTCLAPC